MASKDTLGSLLTTLLESSSKPQVPAIPMAPIKLDRKKNYLQVALNSTLGEAAEIIARLPQSDRIIIEAGTPLIKHYGIEAIRFIKTLRPQSYVVADLKTMDRGETEVILAKQGGASGAIALGYAPVETIDSFISSCEKYGVDSMVDMMNVEAPIKVMRKLKKPPKVVVLHRGVDEEKEELGKKYSKNDLLYLGRKLHVSPDEKKRMRQNVVYIYMINDDSPLETYKLQEEEVYAICSCPVKELMKVHSKKNYSFKTSGLDNKGNKLVIEVNKNSFPYNWDNYHFKIALLADRFIKGEKTLLY